MLVCCTTIEDASIVSRRCDTLYVARGKKKKKMNRIEINKQLL